MTQAQSAYIDDRLRESGEVIVRTVDNRNTGVVDEAGRPVPTLEVTAGGWASLVMPGGGVLAEERR